MEERQTNVILIFGVIFLTVLQETGAVPDDVIVLRLSADSTLEVRYNGGNWGEINAHYGESNQFTDKTANVACRQMGFLVGKVSASVVQVNKSEVILEDVDCATGAELNLSECNYRKSTTSTNRVLAIKVECTADPALNGLLNVTLNSSLDKDTKAHEGILQVTTKDGINGEVCYDANTAEAVSKVVCKQMGYSGVDTTAQLDSNTTSFYDARCPKGTEQTLAACTLTHTLRSTKKVINVTCRLDKATQRHFDIRLSSWANRPAEGTVEVYQYGRWGVVCDTDWDKNEAEVVCRELGYKSATFFQTGAKFGQGTGVVFWNKMRCNGNEPSIAKCTKDVALGTKTCDSANAAGVLCGRDKFSTIDICSNGPKVLEAGVTMIQSEDQPKPFTYSKGQTCFLNLTSPTNFTVYIYKKMFQENHVEYLSFISAARNETLYGDDSSQGPFDFNSRSLTIEFKADTASGSGVINIMVSVAQCNGGKCRTLPPPKPTAVTTTTNGKGYTGDPGSDGTTTAGIVGGVVGVTITLVIVFAVGISLWLWRSGKCAGRRQDDNKMAVIGGDTGADVNTTPVGGEYENVGDPAYENSAFAVELPGRANPNSGTTPRGVVYENMEGIGFYGQNNISRAETLEALPGGGDHGETASETVGESLYARLEPVNRPEYVDFRSFSAEQLKPTVDGYSRSWCL